MNEDRTLFILAGNGPYENRGCEAIVRGTTKILRKYFVDPQFVCLTNFSSKEQYEKQSLQEIDDAIYHLPFWRLRKRDAIQNFWKPETWSYIYRLFFNQKALRYQIYSNMLPYLDKASAVLSVGGDNYSLDYGVPTFFTDLDDFVLERERPLAIWGASIGPFDKIPEYEEYISQHLKKITAIFARESLTVNYLKGINIAENVYHISDPAFLMDPEKPDNIENILSIDEETIGINLSPLMAKYVTNGDLEAWAKRAGTIIRDVAQKTEMPICMIPHVTIPYSNDYVFMQHALSFVHKKNCKITLVPPEYNAAETKWIISKMVLFAGARTHSTIAALSSGVPTLSFAYSIKAQGINRDLFGHTDYCLEPSNLNIESVSDRIESMLNDSNTIKKELSKQIPQTQKAGHNAGIMLRQIIGDD